MRSYPCVIVGLPYEGRAAYVQGKVREGDEVILKREPSNPRDPNAVACYHRGRHIGYIPSRKGWVCQSIEEGDTHQVFVTGFDLNEDDELSAVEIEISIISDGKPQRQTHQASTIKSIVTEIGAELRLLAMVAKADGRLGAKERDLIERFAELRAQDTGLEPDEGEAAHAVRWARRHIPSGFDAARMIGRLAVDRPDALQAMWEVCELVAEVDGNVKEEEAAAVVRLRGLLDEGIRIAREKGTLPKS